MRRNRHKQKAAPQDVSVAWRRFLPLLIVGAGLLAYHNSFSGVFILDDEYHIVENERIRQLWPPWPLLDHRRPVVEISLALNYAWGRLDVGGYHVFNVAIHLLAGLTLFGLVRRTLLVERFGQRFARSAHWWALAVALIWVVHPLQTQSVTYVIQRGESMMGLFYLLTLYCTVRGATSVRPAAWYIGAVIACALGMGCKAVMITAPVVVLLYDWTFLCESVRRAIRRRWPLYAGLIATFSIPAVGGLFRSVLAPPADATVSLGFGYEDVTPWQYLMTQSEVLLHYLRLSFWPDPLCFDYAWPVVDRLREVILPGIVILLLLVVTVWALWRRWWPGFAGAWFFVILSPTSSFVPIKDVAFEHRMYLPLAGVIVVAVGGAATLGRKLADALDIVRPARRAVGAIAVTAVVATLTYGTVQRNEDYDSRLTMWSKVAALRSNNSRAHLNLGNALFNADLERAMQAYERALSLDPSATQARHNLANAALKQGRLEDAVEGYREVVAQEPGYVRAWYNMGNALRRLGRRREAVEAYQAALEIAPDYHDARTNLGLTLAEMGEIEQAIDEYETVLRANADHVGARMNLGAALANAGRLSEAEAQFRIVAETHPNQAAARYRLGVVLSRQGRFDEAVRWLQRALALKPGDAGIRAALAEAQARRK
jgi:tetratricopeptide (TPR) repeat protein